MKVKPLPSQARLRELLSYDPQTGGFIWVANVARRCAIGTVAGSHDSAGYRRIKIDGVAYAAHRIAWMMAHGIDLGEFDIDHHNLKRDDNSISNLRPACASKNKYNSPIYSNNTSGVKGVSWAARQKRWKAQINHCRSRRHLGYFIEISEAETAVREARKNLHGVFARNS